MRPFLLALAVFCIWTRSEARNETVHACELVLKCFQDADAELLQCQRYLMVDFVSSGSIANTEAANNETEAEPTLPPDEDCMAPIKIKMQQRRELVDQRTEAFAACLSQRMDRGSEDVDPRKYRYCNTAISRYTARTTVPTTPEFTVVTSPATVELSTTAQPKRNATKAISATTSKPKVSTSKISASNLSSHISGSTSKPTQKTTRSALGVARPRRRAANANLDLNNEPSEAANGTDIIRPPASWQPEKRKEQTGSTADGVTTPSEVKKAKSDDQLEQGSGRTSLAPQQSQSENEGKIGAVARFSLNGLLSSAKKQEGEENGKSTPHARNATSRTRATTTSPQKEELEIASSSIPEIAQNQNKSQAVQRPKSSPKSISTTTPAGVSPPAAGPPGTPILAGPPGAQVEENPTKSHNKSISLRPQQTTSSPNTAHINNSQESVNDSAGGSSGSKVAEQQWPIEQSIDSPPQEVAKNAAAPETLTVPDSTDGQVTGNSDLQSSPKKQLSKTDALKESRRLVSEFKACMARARIKREECKPLVNCCPDAAKCHLRYELSELHDQIHRLELEIAEGRVACLEKKKENDSIVDPIDQIDEEDLISDESIVSQQIF